MNTSSTMRIGYIRANTKDDFYETQLNALADIQCGRIFEDIGSSFTELEHMLDYLREEDTVCVYQMDRFGLSVKHLMKFTYDLMAKNIALTSIKDKMDTASSEGELLFKIFNVLSLCEQNAIPLRTDLRTENLHTVQPINTMRKTEDLDPYSNVRIMATPKEPHINTDDLQIRPSIANVGGRPRGLTAEAKQKAEAAAAMYQEGNLSMREIAGNLNISTATLYSYLRHEKVI